MNTHKCGSIRTAKEYRVSPTYGTVYELQCTGTGMKHLVTDRLLVEASDPVEQKRLFDEVVAVIEDEILAYRSWITKKEEQNDRAHTTADL